MFKVILTNGKVLPNEFINIECAKRFITLNKLDAHIERCKEMMKETTVFYPMKEDREAMFHVYRMFSRLSPTELISLTTGEVITNETINEMKDVLELLLDDAFEINFLI